MHRRTSSGVAHTPDTTTAGPQQQDSSIPVPPSSTPPPPTPTTTTTTSSLRGPTSASPTTAPGGSDPRLPPPPPSPSPSPTPSVGSVPQTRRRSGTVTAMPTAARPPQATKRRSGNWAPESSSLAMLASYLNSGGDVSALGAGFAVSPTLSASDEGNSGISASGLRTVVDYGTIRGSLDSATPNNALSPRSASASIPSPSVSPHPVAIEEVLRGAKYLLVSSKSLKQLVSAENESDMTVRSAGSRLEADTRSLIESALKASMANSSSCIFFQACEVLLPLASDFISKAMYFHTNQNDFVARQQLQTSLSFFSNGLKHVMEKTGSYQTVLQDCQMASQIKRQLIQIIDSLYDATTNNDTKRFCSLETEFLASARSLASLLTSKNQKHLADQLQQQCIATVNIAKLSLMNSSELTDLETLRAASEATIQLLDVTTATLNHELLPCTTLESSTSHESVPVITAEAEGNFGTPQHTRSHHRHSHKAHVHGTPTQPRMVQMSSQLLETLRESIPTLAEGLDHLAPPEKDNLLAILADALSSASDKRGQPAHLKPGKELSSESEDSDTRPIAKRLTTAKSFDDLNTLASLRSNNINHTNDFQQILLRQKIGRRVTFSQAEACSVPSTEAEVKTAAEREHAEDELTTASAVFGDLILTTLVHSTAFVSTKKKASHGEFFRVLTAAYKILLDIMMLCFSRVSQESKDPDFPFMKELFEEVMKNLNAVTLTGVANEDISQVVEGDFELQCFNLCNSVRVLLCELLSVISSICNSSPCTLHLLEIMAITPALAQTLTDLATCVETVLALKMQHKLAKMGSSACLPIIDDTPLWTEITSGKKYIYNAENKIRAASLNKLVECVTSSTTLDIAFLKTFASTCLSFTTPSKLLDKLLERYAAPASVSTEEARTIQMRVIIFLKHMVELQFDVLDETVLIKMESFIESTQKDGWGPAVFLLESELKRRRHARELKINSLLIPPFHIIIPEERISPVVYFMSINPLEIARQLTLIDATIFCAIRPRELLDLAWNKPKLQHRAPNVIHMLTRCDKLSHWLAQLILTGSDSYTRNSIYVKLVNIALEIKRLSNYHTLMAFIAGLNCGSVIRLKLNSALGKEKSKTWKNIETLMDISSSFKNYRLDLLANLDSVALPFLGVYLSDLTFIDEGNPDTIDNMINFDKRILVYNVLSLIQQRQHQTYTFPIVEPLHTFLQELPSLPDKTLYQLSLLRKPRAEPSPTPGEPSPTSSTPQKSRHKM
ncbi:Ras guanine nucleotide exchange factor [Pelomyxa schiedti]|nr:Ras guanine nucleotide exchange factor [Pelomyxa schiedti]